MGDELKMEGKVLSLRKKVLFTVILCVGFLGLLEVVGVIYYHLVFSGGERESVEGAIGLRHSEDYHVLRYAAHPYFNYVGNPDYRFPDGTQPHNSKGFRRPEWVEKGEGVVRIVALGGSTTYGMYSRDGRDVWPALLEGELRGSRGGGVEVLNLGLPAYTANEVIGVAAMLVPVLEPDIVLIHVGANDAFSACYPDEGGPDNTLFRYSWRYEAIPGFLRFWMRRSRLVRVLGYRYIASRGFFAGDMNSAMQYRQYPIEKARRYAGEATGKYFRQHIGVLVSLAAGMGAVPVLFTHPLSPKWEYPGGEYYRAVVGAHRRNNDMIREVGELRGVRVVDLYSRMRDAAYFSDAIHESDVGMKIKVGLIAPVLNEIIKEIKSKK